MLKELISAYLHSGIRIRNEEILYKNKKFKKGLKFIDLKNKIRGDCEHFQAFDTELLFKHALEQGRSSSYFGHFIREKLGEEQINTFIESYDELREKRNRYKAIPPFKKDISKIKADLDNFREILLSKYDSPMIILEEFCQQL